MQNILVFFKWDRISISRKLVIFSVEKYMCFAELSFKVHCSQNWDDELRTGKFSLFQEEKCFEMKTPMVKCRNEM